MQLELITIILTIIQFHSSFGAYCRTSNDHKNYTCVGFSFKQFTVPRITRGQLLRVRAYDCKETEIQENALYFPNVENLTISCDIQDIHQNAFENFGHLQELDLGNNTLSTLSEQVFQPLGELKTLNLSRNNFERLTQNLFKGLHNLRQLILSYNKLSEFHSKTFDNIQQLEELYLNNNDIHFITGRLFNKLRRIRHIDLSYNTITNLGDIFVPTYKLSYLNLSHNEIEDIPVRAFQTTNVKVLDLSYNKLTTIYEDSLRLDILQEFYLQHNKISFVEIDVTGINKIPLKILDLQNNMLVFLNDNFIKTAINLVTLKLERNPWDCKCLEQLEMLRHSISLETNTRQGESEQPLCITANLKECKVDKTNLTYYYNIFKQF